MGIIDFWLPILVAGALTFVVGALIWMVMPWHKTDFRKTNDEEGVRAALKGQQPGTYTVPHALTNADYQSEQMQQKFKDGPQAFIIVVPSGLPQMGPKLIKMFGINLAVAALCAYFLVMAPTDNYMDTFRLTCTVSWTAYGMAYLQESVWFGRPWSHTVKSLVDALIYGLVTGGVFGWLA
jgi:hypothetical protein